MIKANDFKKKYNLYRVEIDRIFRRVMSRGWFILGSEVKNFEQKFASYLGVKHVVGVGSGTEALFLALKALGVGVGDEVITVAHTATPTISAIRLTGAYPVFVDLDSETMLMDANLIENKINNKTNVILPVHLYGRPVEMKLIMFLARKYNLAVVEDCAQATGAKYRGQSVGTIGTIGCFSFYPTKNLGAFGDAGAIATNDDRLAKIVQQLRNYGESAKYHNVIEGGNSRLDELQAAFLSWGLSKLNHWNRQRKLLSDLYRHELVGVPVVLPPSDQKGLIESSWHLFVIRTKDRDELLAFLQKKKIQATIHYPQAVYQQPAYKFLKIKDADLPATAQTVQEVISLPLAPELTAVEVKAVCVMIKKFFDDKSRRSV